MAKQTKVVGGVSKVRFILIEAEGDSADLSDITQAIQGALGPRQVIQQRIIAGETTRLLDMSSPAADDDLPEHRDLELSAEDTKQKSRQPAAKRNFPTPEVVDVDWSAPISVEDYVNKFPPKNVNEKYLTVLSWFKQQKSQDIVTVNEVYTAFKKLKWSTAIKDFGQPLRDLKGQQVLTGGSRDGFKINHIGVSRVEER